jgi:hypothetical protein
MKASSRILAILPVGALAVAVQAAPPPAEATEENPIIWSLGEPNGVSIEFAPGSRPEAAYRVGESVVSRDFPGRQSGSVQFDGAVSESLNLMEPGSIGNPSPRQNRVLAHGDSRS